MILWMQQEGRSYMNHGYVAEERETKTFKEKNQSINEKRKIKTPNLA
jgi:hypothetical protein